MPANKETITFTFNPESLIIIGIIVLIIILVVVIIKLTKSDNEKDDNKSKEETQKTEEKEELEIHNKGDELEEKEDSNLSVFAAIVIGFLVVLMMAISIVVLIKCSQEDISCTNETQTVLYKEKPKINCSQTLSGVNFDIQANDNYDSVTISYKLLNGSQTIKSGEFTLYDMKKGTTYTKTLTFSVSEMLNCSSVQCSIVSYK